MMFYKIFYYDVTAEEILHCHNVPNKHSITAGFLKQTFHHHHSSPEKKTTVHFCDVPKQTAIIS